jgi:hypothetical protein
MRDWTARHAMEPSDCLRLHHHCHSTSHGLRCHSLREAGGRDWLTLRRSNRKRLKRFHRPAIPAASEITLSISRGFAPSSERGPCVGRRPTVGDGTADGKFTFVTSASYSRSTPTQGPSRCCLYLRLHRPFFLPPFDQAFADAIALLQEACDHASHLSGTVITLDYVLVLINDHGYALKERCQSGDVV